MRVLAVMFLLVVGATDLRAQNTDYTRTFLDPSENASGTPVLVAEVGLSIQLNGDVWTSAMSSEDLGDISVHVQRVVIGNEPPWRPLVDMDLSCRKVFLQPKVKWKTPLPATRPCEYPMQPSEGLDPGRYNFMISFWFHGRLFVDVLRNIPVQLQ